MRTALDCIKLILSSYEPGNPFDEVKQKHSPETHLQALRVGEEKKLKNKYQSIMLIKIIFSLLKGLKCMHVLII